MKLLMGTACVMALSVAAGLDAEEFHSKDLDRVLQKHVSEGRVDYQGLLSNPRHLDAFLARAATVERDSYERWSRSQQTAFLINLYNAATLRLILDHYPLKSIKEIGNFLKGPWDQRVVDLWGEKTTLNHLEHGLLRKMGDPRIHFAIVCASVGCPRLQAVAYDAEKLDRQLDAAARGFLREEGKNQIDPKKGVLRLSPIFKWFSGDFEAKSGSVRAYVASFLPKQQAAFVINEDTRLEYTDYDWSLNE